MRLLFDTDLFCKLGIAGLLDAALDVLGSSAAHCARLPALPHMLRRGRLPKLYGVERCAALAVRAESFPVIPTPSMRLLDALTGATDVDPGEAQLFAVAAELGLLLVTGDKRAVRVVTKIPAFRDTLAGRIVTFEAVLLSLCTRLGDGVIRDALHPLAEDNVVRVCFSPKNASPADGLRSYVNSLNNELHPFVLWDPSGGGIE